MGRYERGKIRTDSGEYIDKGNLAWDPRHPDFGNHGADPEGLRDSTLAFADCDTEAGRYGGHCAVGPGTYRITQSITLNRGWTFHEGAILRPESGVTVTLAGPFEAGLYQCFDLSGGGSVVVQNADRSTPEWWGLTGSRKLFYDEIGPADTTRPGVRLPVLDDGGAVLDIRTRGAVPLELDPGADSTNAILDAIQDAVVQGVPVYIPAGQTYKFSPIAPLNIAGPLSIVGNSARPGALVGPGAGTAIRSEHSLRVEGVRFESWETGIQPVAETSTTVDSVVIRHCSFSAVDNPIRTADAFGTILQAVVEWNRMESPIYGVAFTRPTIKQGYVGYNAIFNNRGQGIVVGPYSTSAEGDPVGWTAARSQNITVEGNLIVGNGTIAGSIEPKGILVYAESVSIRNNYLKELISGSTGADREAIYTKAVYHEISDNIIIDCDGNEGAITCKGEGVGSGRHLGATAHVLNNQVIYTEGTTAARTAGIYCGRDSIVMGNRIVGAITGIYCKGISAAGGVGLPLVVIHDNRVDNCTTGIHIRETTAVGLEDHTYSVQDNVVTNFTSRGILVAPDGGDGANGDWNARVLIQGNTVGNDELVAGTRAIAAVVYDFDWDSLVITGNNVYGTAYGTEVSRLAGMTGVIRSLRVGGNTYTDISNPLLHEVIADALNTTNQFQVLGDLANRSDAHHAWVVASRRTANDVPYSLAGGYGTGGSGPNAANVRWRLNSEHGTLTLYSRTRAGLPDASVVGAGAFARVTNPEAGKGPLVMSNGTAWVYAGDNSAVTIGA